MKKILIMTLINLSIASTSLSAFDSGSYVCGSTVYTLKNNHQYSIKGLLEAERGPWVDHDDAAVLWTKNGEVTIEKSGTKFIRYSNPLLTRSCDKVDTDKLDEYLSKRQEEQTKINKQRSVEIEKERIKKIPERAKEIAYFLKSEYTKAQLFKQEPMAYNMVISDLQNRFNGLEQDLKEVIVKELQSMNFFIEGIAERNAEQQKEFVATQLKKKTDEANKIKREQEELEIAERENQKINVTLLENEITEKKAQLKLDKELKEKKDLLLKEQQIMLDQIKRDEKKVEREARKALRNKKKEILAIWEDFDKKYNFIENLNIESNKDNHAKCVLTDEVLDAFFDMRDKLEVALPSLVPTGKYGNRFSNFANELEKYYDYDESNRIRRQSYLGAKPNMAVEFIKNEVDKLKS